MMKFSIAILPRAILLAIFYTVGTLQAPAQTPAAPSTARLRGTAIDAPAPAAVTPAVKPESIRTTLVGGREYRVVDFQWLASYPFDSPNEKLTNDAAVAQLEKQIPAGIKALDGKNVMIRGFMVPVKDAQGHATEFLIVRDQPNCCYSGMTTITEFVSVKVPSPGVASIMDQPITVQGKLHVGAVLESGYVMGIYRMDGEKLVDSPKS
jgi:hypothetical protein